MTTLAAARLPLWQARLERYLSLLVGVLALVGVGGLLAEHGFYEPPIALFWCRTAQVAAVAAFVLSRLILLLVGPNRAVYAREHWFDLTLIGAAAVALIIERRFTAETVLKAGAIYVATLQVLLAAQVAMQLLQFNVAIAQSRWQPARLMVISFVVVILAGTALLALPKATTANHSNAPWTHLLNSLFTATSATCVTGLIVYDTPHDFTLFGKIVILCLIQLGGLGVMIFGTVFGILLGRQLSLRESAVLQEIVRREEAGRLGRTIAFIVASTFAIEAVGAALLYPIWQDEPSSLSRWFYAIFHAVSAFCNAGFSLQSDSLVSLGRFWQIYGVLMPLIVLGGLGFPVLQDITRWLINVLARVRRGLKRRFSALVPPSVPTHRWSLHTRLVLTTTVLLIGLGAASLLLFETPWQSVGYWASGQGHHLLADRFTGGSPQWMSTHSLSRRMLDAIFQSVTARTAGFNTVPLEPGTISPASLLMLAVLMFIGGSPASTAGGIKTVSFAVMLLAVAATLRRRSHVELFARTIPDSLVRRAATLIFLMTAWLSLAALILCHTERADFLSVIFETISAGGTVGLTTGITPQLTPIGKSVIILTMFAGRLGPLTLLVALAGTERTKQYEFPAESVIIG